MKNTYLANLRVIGLSVAMLFQPIAGFWSDRSTAKMGRRRPFIIWGALLNVIFLFIIGSSPSFMGANSKLILGVSAAYLVLTIGTILMQFSSNLGQAAVQGLMPDVVPENQRGRSSGYKSLLELLPAALVALFVGKMVDKGQTWPVIGIIMAGFIITMLITVIFVKEEPLKQKPAGKVLEPVLRILALTAIFVGVTRAAIWLVSSSGKLLTRRRRLPQHSDRPGRAGRIWWRWPVRSSLVFTLAPRSGSARMPASICLSSGGSSTACYSWQPSDRSRDSRCTSCGM